MRTFALGLLVLFAGSVYWQVSDRVLVGYPRTEFWIQSAKCAQSTGSYLVVCDSVREKTPIEDVSLADDRGHTLMLSVLADVFDIEPGNDVLRALNIVINFVGIALLTGVLLRYVGSRVFLFAILLGTYWVGARAGPDVDASYIGVATLGASALILAATKRTYTSLLAIFSLLSFVALIREPIGLGASLSLLLLAVVMLILNRHEPRRWRRTALLLVIAMVAIKIPSLPTFIRDKTLGTKAIGTAAHGLSHNLFLGLGGFVENKWGIVWDDVYAAKLMKQLHPEIEYCSDAYFKLIGELYWSYIVNDPVEALRVYTIKIGRTFWAAGGLSWSAFLSLIAFSALIFRANRRSISISHENILLILGPALFGLSFIAQGVLTHPAWNYIYPGPILLMICVGILADLTIPALNS